MLQRKFFVTIIAICLLFSFSSCGTGSAPESATNNIAAETESEDKKNTNDFQNINWNESITKFLRKY